MTNVISSGYFRAMQIPIVDGRDFDDRDHAKAQRVMIVNQHMAEMLWPGECDRKTRLIGAESRDLIEVVGVVKTGKYRTLAEDAKPYFYYPMTQRRPANMNLVMRTGVDPRQLAGAIRKEVQNIDRSVPVSSMKTMTEHLTYALWAPNMAASLSLAFGLLAMLLSAVGLYSVMAYVVSQRTREVGIRMALGANRADVLRMITAQGMRLAVIGVAVGLLLSLALARTVVAVDRRQRLRRDDVRHSFGDAGAGRLHRLLPAGSTRHEDRSARRVTLRVIWNDGSSQRRNPCLKNFAMQDAHCCSAPVFHWSLC